ncbi:hypothetical protein Ae717Ps2_7356c [Pseudonocardia sp. Ae717_Ps2]|nr:hypothetical protein Ae717Ps2_7356c [Pseudonocardia sp. Ae717_Ps2]
MRHHRGHSLRELRRALSAAWRHLTQSRGWKRWKTDLDMDYVREWRAPTPTSTAGTSTSTPC